MEKEIQKEPKDYDLWFDYCNLEEQQGNVERTRSVFARAVANVPPVLTEKLYWKRYIYIWLNYALFEE